MGGHRPDMGQIYLCFIRYRPQFIQAGQISQALVHIHMICQPCPEISSYRREGTFSYENIQLLPLQEVEGLFPEVSGVHRIIQAFPVFFDEIIRRVLFIAGAVAPSERRDLITRDFTGFSESQPYEPHILFPGIGFSPLRHAGFHEKFIDDFMKVGGEAWNQEGVDYITTNNLVIAD